MALRVANGSKLRLATRVLASIWEKYACKLLSLSTLVRIFCYKKQNVFTEGLRFKTSCENDATHYQCWSLCGTYYNKKIRCKFYLKCRLETQSQKNLSLEKWHFREKAQVQSNSNWLWLVRIVSLQSNFCYCSECNENKTSVSEMLLDGRFYHMTILTLKT